MTNSKNNTLSRVEKTIEQLVSLYKLTHIEEIRKAKRQVLSRKSRKEVYDLCDGKKSVSEIAKILKFKQPTITHHLTELSNLGFVSSKTEKGKKLFFKVI